MCCLMVCPSLMLAEAFSSFLLADRKSPCFWLDIPAYNYAWVQECMQSVKNNCLDSITAIYSQGPSLSCDELLHFCVQKNFCYTYENSRYELVIIGPHNFIDSHILSRIARTAQGISFEDVPKTGGQNFLLGVTFRFLFWQERFYQFTGW